jgi:signal recognition particle GTPase
MTPEERENPEIIKKETTRIGRISKGAGIANSELRSLLKQYDLLNSMIKDSSGMDFSEGLGEKQFQKMIKKIARNKGKFKI